VPVAERHARSIWFPGPRAVEVRSEVLPPVGDGDVLVEALASAVSHGTEMLVYRGQVPPGFELDLPTLRGSFSFPIKYGYASVGRIAARGSAVHELDMGDLVFVHHPHQSAYVVPASMPIKLPEGVPPEHGAFLANLETATNIVLDAAPRLGERVAIFGQGVVGLLITQLLLRTGASRVIAVEPVEDRRRLGERFGAHAALDPRSDVVGPIRDISNGQGVDVAIEASANGAALGQAIESLAFGGTLVVCSWYGTKPVQVPLGGAFHRRRLRLVSSQVSTIDGALQPRWTHRRRLDVAVELLGSLQLEPLISQRVSFECAADAYTLIDTHPEQTVQVMFTYA
jgi:2-desacetyl-2-hydroxyethyl bacteriochlorophyllide A dehydrogenase